MGRDGQEQEHRVGSTGCTGSKLHLRPGPSERGTPGSRRGAPSLVVSAEAPLRAGPPAAAAALAAATAGAAPGPCSGSRVAAGAGGPGRRAPKSRPPKSRGASGSADRPARQSCMCSHGGGRWRWRGGGSRGNKQGRRSLLVRRGWPLRVPARWPGAAAEQAGAIEKTLAARGRAAAGPHHQFVVQRGGGGGGDSWRSGAGAGAGRAPVRAVGVRRGPAAQRRLAGGRQRRRRAQVALGEGEGRGAGRRRRRHAQVGGGRRWRRREGGRGVGHAHQGGHGPARQARGVGKGAAVGAGGKCGPR